MILLSLQQSLLGDCWYSINSALDFQIVERRPVYRCTVYRRSRDTMSSLSDCILLTQRVEYITYHGHFADVPLEDLLNGWRELYGEDRVQFWMKYFTEISPETFSV